MIKNSLIILVASFLISCSARKLVLNQLEPVVDEMQKSILAESEPKLVSGALPFAIKLTESLHRYYPLAPYYPGKLALLYAAYTFGYVDETPYSDFDDEAELKMKRISHLYQRSFDYGLKSLSLRYPNFDRKIFQANQVDELLKKIRPESVEVLFWFNFSWALNLLYHLDDVSSLVHLETIKKIAELIDRLDPNYLHGINKAVLITYYGGRTVSLGGDPDQAKQYYQQSLAFSKGKSIVNDFVYFRFVTIQNEDSSEFEKFYQKIKNFDLDQNPSFYFVNRMVQKKAEKFYTKKNFFF